MSDDLLRCVECGAETNVSAESVFESLGKTRRGKWRKRTRWLKALAEVVDQWRCDDCLTRAETDE